MPTRARPHFARQALRMWEAQTYPNRELIVIDEEFASSLGGVELPAGVVREVLRSKLNIGAKRNLACSMAAGEIIVHWDDDDLSHPDRIAEQVRALQTSGKSVAGFPCINFWDQFTGQLWRYLGADGYMPGTSLCYWRTAWSRSPFVQIDRGEEVHWLVKMGTAEMLRMENDSLMLARHHENKGRPQFAEGRTYHALSLDALPEWTRPWLGAAN